MKKTHNLLVFFILISSMAIAGISVDHVDPPFWWCGMQNKNLQLLIHGEGIGKSGVEVNYQGVTVKTVKPAGLNYLFINLFLAADAKPGKFTLIFKEKGVISAKVDYELKSREKGSKDRQGFSASDAIYLVMPDRFANGDTSNDNLPSMTEKANRSKPDGRHGGDIKGILDHLDYIVREGFTALWLNPVLENNMPAYSYHGYAITDFYKVDARFGSNKDYAGLVTACHSKGLKVIMDMVFNHCGSQYWWMSDLPTPDWVHQWPEFTRSNYRAGVVTDPYASGYDTKRMVEGWFDVTMPDLDQRNPFVANYLIQNSIWWVEMAGLDGIRMDTYPYSDKEFMKNWMKRIREEYPQFSVVGEVWMNTPSQVAYWLHDSPRKTHDESFLTNAFDFPLMFAIQQAFTETDGWSTGMTRLYETLSLDFVYSQPNDLVIFADNHDIDRMASMLKSPENVSMALAFLCTTRGIPLFYYGSEILMKGWAGEGHGTIRRDFPGGWAGDTVNAFTRKGLTTEQTDVMTSFAKLLNWRKTNLTVQQGKLIHYIPEDGIYVYFRTLNKSSVMVVLNNNKDARVLKTGRFSDNLKGFSTGKNILTGELINHFSSLDIPPKSAVIIELY
ncbi:MAG: glycoside hydrolase family 13 protein [Bacteroidetes bacterium]|nr:glycoside hydrolase family 13 protein [Bacteroidota bacterium]